jgi:hypothetical protein
MALLKHGLFHDVAPKFDFCSLFCVLLILHFFGVHLMRYRLCNLFAIIDCKNCLIMEIAAMWLNVLINPVECCSNN